MNRILTLLFVLLLPVLAVAFDYTGDGSNGFVSTETVTADNMNEIDTALDAIEGGIDSGTADANIDMAAFDITLDAGSTVDGVDVSLFKQDMTFLLDQSNVTIRRESADSAADATARNNNETAFAAALDDACSDATAGGSTDGGILHLPPGRFAVDAATLDIDCRVIIQGTGRQGFTLGGSEIYINATGLSTHGLQITSDNVVLRDLLINCDNADTAGFNCVEAVDSGGTIAKVVFDNISINGDGATYTTTTGLEIDGAQEFIINNSFIDTFGRAVHFMGSGSAGGNQITNSWLRTPDGYGEVVLITGADPIRDLTIQGTSIQRGITGIRLNPDDSTNASVLNLSNNYFETTCTDASPDDGTCDVGGGSEAALTNVLIDSDAGFTSNQDFYNPSTATAVSRTTAQASGTDMIISPWLRGDVSYSAGTCSTTGLVKGAGDITDCTTFGAGGSGAFSDSADPIVQNTTTKDVAIGTSAINTSKLSVDGDADQVQLSIQAFSTQTDSVIIVENSAGTEVVAVEATGAADFAGAVTATSFTADPSATPSMDFVDSDTTDEDNSVSLDANCTDLDAGTEDCDFTIVQQIAGSETNRAVFDADGDVTLTGPVVITGGLDAAPKGATSTGGALTINTVTIATAAGDYDLPDACDTATFNSVTVLVRDVSETVSLTVTDSADQIHYKGLTLDADDELDSPGAALDSVTVICMEAGEWYVTSNSGAWTDGGASD